MYQPGTQPESQLTKHFSQTPSNSLTTLVSFNLLALNTAEDKSVN